MINFFQQTFSRPEPVKDELHEKKPNGGFFFLEMGKLCFFSFPFF